MNRRSRSRNQDFVVGGEEWALALTVAFNVSEKHAYLLSAFRASNAMSKAVILDQA